ncbi:MAG: hypothetical protein ABW360_02495 [Phenylobacterium sp.]
MTQGFQQQDTQGGFVIPKTAARPQHGQKADRQAVKAKESRSFEPRPGR